MKAILPSTCIKRLLGWALSLGPVGLGPIGPIPFGPAGPVLGGSFGNCWAQAHWAKSFGPGPGPIPLGPRPLGPFEPSWIHEALINILILWYDNKSGRTEIPRAH